MITSNYLEEVAAARLELFTRPDGLKPGRGQRHIQLYSPWLPANDKSNPASNDIDFDRSQHD